ncbi:MAG: ribose 5-phosphate isomerase B [Collinsella aerofaciens]
MKIGIGNDHAAVELKNIISEHLKERGCEVVNFGTDTSESFDYPIAGYKVGKAVANGDVDLGILICGTGVGISLAANKVEGVRAVVCSEPFSAKLSRMHNNTNVLAFGARVVGSELAKMIVDEWLDAEFEGGRHERRVNLSMRSTRPADSRSSMRPKDLQHHTLTIAPVRNTHPTGLFSRFLGYT